MPENLWLAFAAAFALTSTTASHDVLLPTRASQDQTGMKTYDDLLVEVEHKAQGFGGMFIDSDGRLAVYLIDPSRLSAARAAIESVFGASQIPPQGVRALQGQYTVSQLKTWAERATAVLATPGVTAVDLDEAKNRVTVGIVNRSRRQAAERALSSLRIPRKALIIEVIDPISALPR